MSPLVLERSRAILLAAGRDPVKMIHGLATSDIEAVTPEQGAYALFLTAKGRIVADARVIAVAPSAVPDGGETAGAGETGAGVTDGGATGREVDRLWIETAPAALEPLRAHLEKFVPPLFAAFEDVSDDWAVIGVYGEGASAVAGPAVGALGGPDELPADAPEERVVRFEGGFAVHTRLTGDEGWDLFVPAADRDRVVDLLLDAGGRPADPEAVDALRVVAGRPRFGRELTGDVIPLEAGLLERAIDQEKGCYTGQEVIVRILHRGHVNRHLRRLEFDGPPPEPGTELFEPDLEKPRGVVTSTAANEAGAIGLGYVRREIEPPAELRLGSPAGAPVRVTALDD